MPTLDLELKRDVPVFRKSAIGTWRTVGDPSRTIHPRRERPHDHFGPTAGQRPTFQPAA